MLLGDEWLFSVQNGQNLGRGQTNQTQSTHMLCARKIDINEVEEVKKAK